jgi:hypothetical protein
MTGNGCRSEERIAVCRITMFRLVRGEWRRSDVEVAERCYRREEIDAALERAGFGEVTCYDAHDLGMAGQLGGGRVFYTARK